MYLKRGLLFGGAALLALSILIFCAGAAGAASSSGADIKDHTITVTGTGSVYATPDVAKFSAGVVTEANKSSDAMAGNAQLMDAVVGAIRDSGIQDKDIRTGRISLEPVYNYNTQPKDSSEKPQIVGYRASNSVTVTVRNLTQAGAAIDAANGAGANSINGVWFELSDSLAASTYKQALAKAVSDGADKANTIAAAAGLGNLTLKSVSESGTYEPQPLYFGAAAMPRAAVMAPSTPVSPGEQKVQASVTMAYTFA